MSSKKDKLLIDMIAQIRVIHKAWDSAIEGVDKMKVITCKDIRPSI